jgi:Rrf2 family protein
LFSATFRYALISLLEIASSEAGLNGNDIARRHSLSTTYMANVLSELKRLGILHSRKGRYGGYFLCRLPDEINLLMLQQGLAGSHLALEREPATPVERWLWQLEARWQAELAATTLSDLQRFAADQPAVHPPLNPPAGPAR